MADTKPINICQQENDISSDNTDELEVLGHKLKETLSQYKSSRDSTSAERIKHLTNMNLLVLEIAKAKGVDLESTPMVKLSSWHRKKSRSSNRRSEKEKKRRLEKERKRRRGKDKGRRKEKDERNLSLIW